MSPIETLLARALVDHRLREGPIPIGARCTCGWRPYGLDEHAHRQHLTDRLANALRGEGLVETIEQAILNVAVDHPMWIDNNGAPLDYHPEREARIGDYTTTAAQAVIDSLYGTKETT